MISSQEVHIHTRINCTKAYPFYTSANEAGFVYPTDYEHIRNGILSHYNILKE